MINIKLISFSGSNYFFTNGNFYGFDKGVFCKIDTKTFVKEPLCYGGIMLGLFNGKKLYFTNNAFYIKE